jgi:hypothetical protein
MTCFSCGSARQAELTAELLIHFRGLRHLDSPAVWVFPELLVCLDCGFSRFMVPKTELASVAKNATSGSSRLENNAASDVGISSWIAF